MIVDCHTHRDESWQQRDGLDPTNWLAVLDQHDITHAVVLPTRALRDGGRIAQDNDDVAAVCAKSNGRMIPFCTVNIWVRDEALAELERSLKKVGSRGVKFHPWLQGCSVSSPVMDEVCEMAGAFDVPILFHDGTPPFSLPSQIALLARRHPKTTLVLGHCGLFEHWREAIAAMRSAENLWGCLCSPHLAGLRQLYRHADRTRLVWGSDQGFGITDTYAYRRPLMNLLSLTDAQEHEMFDANPRRLLGL